MRFTNMAALVLALALGGCNSSPQPKPGDVPVFDGIGEEEVVRLSGTEPFWSATIQGDVLTYSTPENIDGDAVAVTRFAGNGGLGFSGELGGKPLQVAVTPGTCNDGMSDRTYPFTATLTLGEAILFGCGYSDSNPYSEPDMGPDSGDE
ncbi:COG3650 family protein [Altererythrobacter sp.]|uniref:COG3650 family protein n=1 Tax=Altererythrobacter sp. TaxID=1872480 RepID=UPI003CFD0B49